MSSFRLTVWNFLQNLASNPHLMEETKHKETKKILKAYCGKGQGLGNKCTDHEACFAVQCESNGWSLKREDSRNGIFYAYQVRGTQRSIDFQIVYLVDGVVADCVNFDLKRSKDNVIFLNDGTFLEDVVYIVSFTRKLDAINGQKKKERQQVCVIALGQDVMTEKDRIALEKRFALIKQLNSVKEDLDHLLLYNRNANKYSCKRFTPEFTEGCLRKTQSWIVPSA